MMKIEPGWLLPVEVVFEAPGCERHSCITHLALSLFLFCLLTFLQEKHYISPCPILEASQTIMFSHVLGIFDSRMFFKWANPGLFLFIFVLSRFNFKNTNWKKLRWCALDSNPLPQVGRRRQNHGAMAAGQDSRTFISPIDFKFTYQWFERRAHRNYSQNPHTDLLGMMFKSKMIYWLARALSIQQKARLFF